MIDFYCEEENMFLSNCILCVIFENLFNVRKRIIRCFQELVPVVGKKRNNEWFVQLASIPQPFHLSRQINALVCNYLKT